MLFFGINHHAGQQTISLREQQGDVLLARQVSHVHPGFYNSLTNSHSLW